jgi:hypothetical protein
VKLGEPANDAFVMLSVAYGGEAMKTSVTRTWKMMKLVVVQNFTQPMKMLKKCGIWCIQIDILSIRAMDV